MLHCGMLYYVIRNVPVTYLSSVLESVILFHSKTNRVTCLKKSLYVTAHMVLNPTGKCFTILHHLIAHRMFLQAVCDQSVT